jgi:hypothetical protein
MGKRKSRRKTRKQKQRKSGVFNGNDMGTVGKRNKKKDHSKNNRRSAGNFKPSETGRGGGRKTRTKARRKARSKTRNKTKRKSRKRGGGERCEFYGVQSSFGSSNCNVASACKSGDCKTKSGQKCYWQNGKCGTRRLARQVVDRTTDLPKQAIDRITDLPKHLRHLVLKGSHPSAALNMYNGPAKNDLRKRMRAMTSITQGVRNRLTTQVVLPGFPLGTLMTADNIAEIMHNTALDDAQDKEVRRLVARLYTNPVDGYTDDLIFGTGAFNSKMAAHVGTHAERKQHRQNLLANGNINDTTINNDNLPLPLQILRKNRLHHRPISDRYPLKDDGSVDETHDVFWPINRREFDFYMKTFPTLNEIQIYGW